MNKDVKNKSTNSQQFDENGELIPSKTALKQASEDLKKLGAELVALSNAHLQEIPLDDELKEAILLAGRINKKKDGYRRQLQLIGKMLRQREIEPIENALHKLSAHHLAANFLFHKIEVLRDQIIETGDAAIQSAINEYPHLDRQKLRQLQRQAVKQRTMNKPPIAAREIFQYLKVNMEE